MHKQFFPKEFIEKYQALLGEEWKEFFECSQQKLKKSLWTNSLKIAPIELKQALEKQDWELKQLAFHENSFEIINQEKPGQCKEFKQGLFNLQEISSMLPAIELTPKKEEFVLDCCAAPGNKTIQLACLMQNTGKLIAVDKNAKRFNSLRFNAKKFGLSNAECYCADFVKFKYNRQFDKILLDSPCSSEGVIRKRFDALKNWSNALVKKKSDLQKSLIAKAFYLLKQKGKIVYSTCSLSPEENEEVIDFLLKKNPNAELEKISINGIKTRNGLLEYNGKEFDDRIRNCARVLPQDNNTQAFFMAKILKN